MADFVCEEVRMVVELDGGQHATVRAESDRRRDAYLEAAGYRVVRIWNTDVMSNLEGVLENILMVLSATDGRRDSRR